jgi:adenylate kinase family enzyme
MDYRNYMPFGYGQIPYYEGLQFPIDMSEEEQMERDKEYMKSLYPAQAKNIQALVDEECDKLEYEGSVMFDEYPDKLSLKKIGKDIFAKYNNDSVKVDAEEISETDELYMMNYNYHRRPVVPGPGPNNPIMDIIDILLFNEIFKRRCRHNRCRRRLYW